jgi:hypothetical protein
MECQFVACPGLFEPIHAADPYDVSRYPGEKGLLQKPIRKLRDNSEIGFKGIGRVNVDWIHQA